MQYVGRAIGSSLGPKILGTYELEIESVIRSVIARAPARIIIVGAGEGYYAVGFAWRLPEARVVAFEANPEAHPLLRELAGKNSVDDRVQLCGRCGAEDLMASLGELGANDSTFLLVDIEGGERELLDPAVIPALLDIEILVETHDAFVPGVEALLLGRFEASHEITPYRQRGRTTSDVRNLEYPPSFAGALATWLPEGRPTDNHWLHLYPKSEAARPRALD